MKTMTRARSAWPKVIPVSRRFLQQPFCRAPDDFDRQLVALRTRLKISQTELGARIGAAGKAVIYQWESRKRRPSPILWRRVIQLVVPASN
jgi:DNA-binding transcriptional regulator YiaG